MKFVDASYKINQIPDPTTEEVYKYLERIGKVCYKSEDKITDESAVKYLRMIRDRKHWAMLEHYVFVFNVSADIFRDIITASATYTEDFMLHDKLRFIRTSSFKTDDTGKQYYLVSGSITSFNYIWECPSMIKNTMDNLQRHGLVKICMFLQRYFSEISKIPDECKEKYDDCGFLGMSKIDLLTRDEIKALPYNHRIIHDTLSVKFVTNLGVSHDLVRSRPVSYAMESTRWINYSKKCGFSYTVPLWFNKDEKEYLLNASESDIDRLANFDAPLEMTPECIAWVNHLKDVENTYNYFSKEMGYKNDRSSLLLPKNFKTELNVTTNILEWKHIFFLRCQNDVRVDMRKIIVPLVKELIESNDLIWDDQRKLYEEVNKDYE